MRRAIGEERGRRRSSWWRVLPLVALIALAALAARRWPARRRGWRARPPGRRRARMPSAPTRGRGRAASCRRGWSPGCACARRDDGAVSLRLAVPSVVGGRLTTISSRARPSSASVMPLVLGVGTGGGRGGGHAAAARAGRAWPSSSSSRPARRASMRATPPRRGRSRSPRAATRGRRPAQALPGWSRGRLTVHVDGRRVRVRAAPARGDPARGRRARSRGDGRRGARVMTLALARGARLLRGAAGGSARAGGTGAAALPPLLRASWASARDALAAASGLVLAAPCGGAASSACGRPATPACALPATARARRLAARLEARGLSAAPRGRLVRVRPAGRRVRGGRGGRARAERGGRRPRPCSWPARDRRAGALLARATWSSSSRATRRTRRSCRLAVAGLPAWRRRRRSSARRRPAPPADSPRRA